MKVGLGFFEIKQRAVRESEQHNVKERERFSEQFSHTAVNHSRGVSKRSGKQSPAAKAGYYRYDNVNLLFVRKRIANEHQLGRFTLNGSLSLKDLRQFHEFFHFRGGVSVA
jgi:hypothetical protein